MIGTIRQGLKADGIEVSITKLCQWFALPRRTMYYRPVKSAPKINVRFMEPIKAMIEENPAFGYRTRAETDRPLLHLPALQTEDPLYRVLVEIEQVCDGSQASPSVAQAPNQRWATDLCRIWADRDQWTTL